MMMITSRVNCLYISRGQPGSEWGDFVVCHAQGKMPSVHLTPSLILSVLLRDQSVTLFTIVTLPSIKEIRLGVKWAKRYVTPRVNCLYISGGPPGSERGDFVLCHVQGKLPLYKFGSTRVRMGGFCCMSRPG